MKLTKEQLDAIDWKVIGYNCMPRRGKTTTILSIRLLPVYPIPRIIRKELCYHIRINPKRS